jgi:hypothetical protein
MHLQILINVLQEGEFYEDQNQVKYLGYLDYGNRGNRCFRNTAAESDQHKPGSKQAEHYVSGPPAG